MQNINKYIKENWNKTITKGGNVGKGYIPIPKDFSVPSFGHDVFIDMFYWDTYFINLGLMQDGFVEQAKNNLENIAYFIENVGYMPNASHLLFTSQPPLFVRGCYDYYQKTKDLEFIKKYLPTMISEYEFFMNERITDCGLNQYGDNVLKYKLKNYYDYFSKRVGVTYQTQEERDVFVKNMFAICESGWDCTLRFKCNNNDFATNQFVQLDINCILYDVEEKIAYFYDLFGQTDCANKFKLQANRRKILINTIMRDEKSKLYFDYNYKTKTFSHFLSAVSFYPYALGISDDKLGLKQTLERLELEYGISACENHSDANLQWDYPVMWAPNVYFAYTALKNCGLNEDAERVAKKYIYTIDKVFKNTEKLWEKYDAKNCSLPNAKDSKDHEMLGWTAGVYRYLFDDIF